MRDHELELIAALVEGRLEDESEARALIASSPEHREEYEAQRLAYKALRGAESVSLTETERAALHRDVWSSLRAQAANEPRRAPWYYRWTPVAAGLFVLIGLVAIVNQGLGGDDALETAADFPVTSTAAATEEADGGDTMAAAGSGGEGATATTTTEERSGQMGSVTLTDAEEAVYTAEAENIRTGDLNGVVLKPYDEDATPSDLQDCVDEADLEGYEVVATLARATVDTTVDDDPAEPPAERARFLVAVPDEVELSDAPVAFVDEATCELVHLDP